MLLHKVKISPVMSILRDIFGSCIERYPKQVIGLVGLAENCCSAMDFQVLAANTIIEGDPTEPTTAVSKPMSVLRLSFFVCISSIWGDEETLCVMLTARWLHIKIGLYFLNLGNEAWNGWNRRYDTP